MSATKPNETNAPVSKRTMRSQVSILLSPDNRARIEQVAEEKQCSFGRAAELIIELYFVYKQTVDDIRDAGRTIQGAKVEVTETALFHQLWTPLRTTRGGRVWAPPNTEFPVELEKMT
jgi:hypothetical protein